MLETQLGGFNMRVLMTATVPSMIGQFNMDNIKLLQELGYEVDVACNCHDYSVWSKKRIDTFKRDLLTMNINIYQIDFERNMFKLIKHFKSYFQMKHLLNKRHYDIIHTHTPISSFITRFAFKNSKYFDNSKLIYTAHGFHFFKGNSLVNNIIFSSLERIAGKYTDILITINNEDYLAAKKFKLRKNGIVKYVPGVGININKINSIVGNHDEFCKELKISTNSTLLLSVGELNFNKNHKIIIDCLPKLPQEIHYIICGVGPLMQQYNDLAEELGVSDRLHLLGYRDDVFKIMKSCDIFIFPSFREGLGLAAIEAMACGMPLITSNRHGILDYAQNGINAFTCNPFKSDEFLTAIKKMNKNLINQFGDYNKNCAVKYDLHVIHKKMCSIYKEDL